MTYRYVQRDLLAQPEKYHFTPIEGPQLISWYRDSRGAAAEAIAEVHGRVALELAGLPAPPEPGSSVVATEEVLRQAVAARRRGVEKPAVSGWAEVFLRKFEVFKKLRAGYGPDLRQLDRTGASEDCYALFALLLALSPRLTDDLRALNCLLKVLDLVCSVDPRRFTPLGGRAAVSALEIECSAVGELAARHGLADRSP